MAPATPHGGERAAKRQKIDFSHEVVVLVGSEQKRFIAHKDALVKSSKFFRAALSGNWRESNKNGILLPEARPSIFSIYLNWLYGESIDLLEDGDTISTFKDDRGNELEDIGMRYERIIRAYSLGSFLGDDIFCNALIDSYFEVMDAYKQWPRADLCLLAFASLADSSKLSLLIVHQIALRASANSFDNTVDGLPPDLIKEIAQVSIRERDQKGRKPEDRDRCYYHVHGKDEQKCAPKK